MGLPPSEGGSNGAKHASKFLESEYFIENGSNWVDMGPFGLKMGRIDVESSQESF